MRRLKKMKGSVLIQVLLTAVIVSIIAAGMMNLILLRATAIKRSQAGATGLANANSGLDAILATWSTQNTKCFNPVPGYTGGSSASPPGNCSCTYASQSNGTIITVTSGGVLGTCNLSISSPMPQ
jgi:hypothetical protein